MARSRGPAVAHVLGRTRATNCVGKLPRIMVGPRQRRTHRILTTELLTVRGIQISDLLATHLYRTEYPYQHPGMLRWRTTSTSHCSNRAWTPGTRGVTRTPTSVRTSAGGPPRGEPRRGGPPRRTSARRTSAGRTSRGEPQRGETSAGEPQRGEPQTGRTSAGEPQRRRTSAGANLSGADLSEADLSGANLSEANLSGADLTRGGPQRGEPQRGGPQRGEPQRGGPQRLATLVNTDLTGARPHRLSHLRRIRVGSKTGRDQAAELGHHTRTSPRSPSTTSRSRSSSISCSITENPRRHRHHRQEGGANPWAFHAGAQSSSRRATRELRKRDYVPILFDFDKPASQDLTATVSTLAHLARFIIADLTDPSSIPYELATVVPTTPIPVQPILLSGCSEFAMFQDLRRRHHWVLPTHPYDTPGQLIADLDTRVIRPAETKVLELRGQ